MSTTCTWAESPLVRHVRLIREIEEGTISDPEWSLFLRLLSDPIPALADTPLLAEVSWGGRFDLLFTDGERRWCAVEVKAAPDIYGTGSSRRHRRDKARERANLLYYQASLSHSACREAHPGDHVIALGLWLDDGEWRVLCSYE